jgi:hypothetical protein
MACLVAQTSLSVQLAARAETTDKGLVKLNKTKIVLNVGDTFRLKVTGTQDKVIWSTSDKRIATVSQKGMVKAKNKGRVKIIATLYDSYMNANTMNGEDRVSSNAAKKKLVCTVVVKDVYFVTIPPIHILLKPIIYLYPEADTELSVRLGKPENITVSYPAYGDGWHVLAQPDGTLVDLKTDRRLYALYWEGKNEKAPSMDEGFVVAGADTASFLEEKLALLGLSDREAEEFIVYWLPVLQDSAYNLIRFETMEEIEDYMPLKLSVEPDTLIRVLMAYRPLEEAVEVPEQVLPQTPERKGFTVVEWGGTKAE